MGTAEFLSKFDSICDCLSSSTTQSTKKCKCALHEKSIHEIVLKEPITLIKGLKVFNGEQEVTSRIKHL